MTDWFEMMREKAREDRDAHQKEREVLFANESFLIGVLQVVAGGSLFAGLAQSSPLIALAGLRAFLSFLTLMAVALTAAVLAAYFKHQYKMWDVKGGAVAQRDQEEANRRLRRSGRRLIAMRWTMRISVGAFALAMLVLLVALWAHFLTTNAGSIPAHVTPSVPKVQHPGTH